VWALEQTFKRPANAQWVQFLRSHDELDLGRLEPEQREKVFAAFAPEKGMQLYDRGIRRRLAPMLGNNRRRLELAFSMLYSLPGTPMMQYGDEIGIGENLRLPERECARTPMQWTADPSAGFSKAKRLVRPVVDDDVFGYEKVNVADQRRDPHSLLNWTERMIRMRKECPEISWGNFSVLRTDVPEVLAIYYEWRETAMVTLHNFSNRSVKVRLKVNGQRGDRLVEVFDGHHTQAHNDGMHRVPLDAYGWRWYRVGSADNVLARSDLSLKTQGPATARDPGKT
jgi:maltose alpha-D-glucosyltransferase/alpha-amylase